MAGPSTSLRASIDGFNDPSGTVKHRGFRNWRLAPKGLCSGVRQGRATDEWTIGSAGCGHLKRKCTVTGTEVGRWALGESGKAGVDSGVVSALRRGSPLEVANLGFQFWDMRIGTTMPTNSLVDSEETCSGREAEFEDHSWTVVC